MQWLFRGWPRRKSSPVQTARFALCLPVMSKLQDEDDQLQSEAFSLVSRKFARRTALETGGTACSMGGHVNNGFVNVVLLVYVWRKLTDTCRLLNHIWLKEMTGTDKSGFFTNSLGQFFLHPCHTLAGLPCTRGPLRSSYGTFFISRNAKIQSWKK